jgi:hypothetical protein
MRGDVSRFRKVGYDKCHDFHRIVDFGDKMLLHRNKTGRISFAGNEAPGECVA